MAREPASTAGGAVPAPRDVRALVLPPIGRNGAQPEREPPR